MTTESFSLKYANRELSVNIIRRDRKTLEISVYPDMSIIVVAPIFATQSKIVEKVRKRVWWITKQIRFFNQFHPRTPERKYVSGETHLYLGRQYRLKVLHPSQEREIKAVRMTRGYLEIRLEKPYQPATIKALTEGWFRRKALVKFPERLEVCISRFPSTDEYKPSGLVIRKMEKRWGSMTQSGRLILNSKLIHAPVDAIDYVITHELCHLKYDEHSCRFFNLLKKIMPDWEKRKTRLELALA